jgi:hypothetical protein
MALTFTTDDANGIIIVTGAAGCDVTFDAIDAVDAAILEATGTSAGLRILYDCRAMSTQHITMQDMEAMAQLDESRWQGATDTRMAICAGTQLTFGQARQYQILSDIDRPWAVGVFADVDAARAWLLGESPADQ